MKWVAHFDKYKINQFNENGNESLFREVLDNIGELTLFCLYDDYSNYYSVDIKTKEISYNGEVILTCDIDNPILLYYRRCYMNFGESVPYIYQCVGLQNSDKEIFLKIDQQLNSYEIIK
ncbi:MAG: hypothetical protein EOL97_12905 [Spirochaetia bacterium]|nr:hypothetical protein [Spirochaetia bacterium]